MRLLDNEESLQVEEVKEDLKNGPRKTVVNQLAHCRQATKGG